MAGRSLFSAPPHRGVPVVGRAWWRKERLRFGRSTLLKFNQTHRAVFSNLFCLNLRQVASYNLVEHLYGKNVSHFPPDRFAVIRPSRAHPDSTSDESRVSWVHIRMNTPWQHELLWGHGNLPKTHKWHIMATFQSLITRNRNYSSTPIFAGAPVGRQNPANQLM